MITQDLSTLNIHQLSQEQFDREKEAGNLDETAIYLTPEEEIIIDQIYSPESLNAQSGIAVAQAISEIEISGGVDLSSKMDKFGEYNEEFNTLSPTNPNGFRFYGNEGGILLNDEDGVTLESSKGSVKLSGIGLGNPLKLSNVDTPVDDNDAANKAYVDSKIGADDKQDKFINVAETDANINLNTDGYKPLIIDGMDYSLGATRLTIGNGRIALEAAGTNSNGITISANGCTAGVTIDGGSYQDLYITNLHTPTDNYDAATKLYVDDAIANIINNTDFINAIIAALPRAEGVEF